MALFKRGHDLEGLLKKLESRGYKDAAEKKALLQELAGYGDLRADDYVRLLLGGDSELRRFALDRIGRCQNPRLIDQLLSVLQRSPRPRWKPLIMALHRVGAQGLAERLGQMLQSKRLDARAAAMEVLAGDPRPRNHTSLLKIALKDSEAAIRVRAVQILGSDATDAELRRLLRDLMLSQDEVVRPAAIEILARHPGPDVIEDFFDLLPNQPPKLQNLMIRGLQRMVAASGGLDEKVLERVLPLLAADDRRIREAAARLLASMRNQLDVLRRFLQYAKGLAFWLRDRAFTAVSTVADDIVEAILTLLGDEDVDVVVGASVMARDSRDPRVCAGLIDLLGRDFDWWVKIPALETLATFRGAEVTGVLLLKLTDRDLRNCALACLGRRADPATLPRVLEFLGHERRGLRRAALGALESFREPALIPHLERVARHDADGECRLVALEMLDGLGAEGVAAAAALRAESRALPAAGDGPTLTLVKNGGS
ncbi:MAG: HEAT repeat domain-containing protein [Planctomycetota bacterium]|jgi:HEAT repeat protein